MRILLNQLVEKCDIDWLCKQQYNAFYLVESDGESRPYHEKLYGSIVHI